MKYIKSLTKTAPALEDTAILLVRIAIGLVLFLTGGWKVFGWLGGPGLAGAVGFYSQIGISGPLAYLSIYTELIGGFLLLIGLITRLAAIPVTINMLVATIVSMPGGFLGPTGFSTPFVFLLCAVAILVTGPHSFSLDRWIKKRCENTPEHT
jgi:putative oxidoreductase